MSAGQLTNRQRGLVYASAFFGITTESLIGMLLPLWALLAQPHAGDDRGMAWLPEIEAHTGKPIRLVVVSPTELQKYTTEFYSLSRSVRAAIKTGETSSLSSFEQLVELGRKPQALAVSEQLVARVPGDSVAWPKWRAEVSLTAQPATITQRTPMSISSRATPSTRMLVEVPIMVRVPPRMVA